MKLTNILKLSGNIELISGLHIGGSNEEIHIGGIDNSVIRNPITGQPYIPGSSIKGKMRSLLEWKLGVVSETNGAPLGLKHLDKVAEIEPAKQLLKLFGGAPTPQTDDSLIKEIGTTRLSFWDCNLNSEWVQGIKDKDLLLTEDKTENTINRIAGTASNPRHTERVPAGAIFDFNLTIKQHDNEDLSPMIFEGLKLLELTGIGGSLSRGYGKIKFTELKLEGEDVQQRLDDLNLSEV